MRILLEKTLAEAAARPFAQHDLIYFDSRGDDRAHVTELASDVDILGFRWPLGFCLDREFLSSCPRLKYVHKTGSGLEHDQVLDLAALDEYGILFSNNAGLNADTVAEHAILLLLLSLRPATIGHVQAARAGCWDSAVPDGVPPSRMLSGKTIGMVGIGQIGTSIVKRLRGMNVGRILGYQRHPRFEHTVYADLEWVGLDTLLETADIVVLSLPINASTQNLIDRRRIGLIREGATLVNVGRGGVLDEEALYEALRDGRLRAAGLDVLAEEPSTSPLMTLPNVVVTPHTAGTAVEMQQLQIEGAIDAIADFTSRRVPRRLVNAALLSMPQLRADWLRLA
jgi:phosphoglycerate dehydrogenase-like enzyme